MCACQLAYAAQLRDDMGHILDTRPAAQRIVALSPHATELVLAAGASHRLVGAAAGTIEIPSHTQSLAVLGGLDRELLLQLHPDLVIAWASGNRQSDLRWLRRLGIAVYESEPKELPGISRNIRDIGRLAGTSGQAERTAAAFDRQVSQACATSAPQPVYLELWQRPRLSLGGRHWLNDLLERANMQNIFGALDRGVFALENEAAMQAETFPRLLLGSDHPLAGLLSRPGPQIVQALQRLCADPPLSPGGS